MRCLYIEGDNRCMFLTEITNVGKPDVEIDVKYSERDRTVRYGLLAISALSYTENQGGATRVTENQRGVTGVNENCVDENTLKIEDKKSIQIEKAYRLGKRKNGPTKLRPIVVKFTNYKDRAAVKNSQNRLKNTKYESAHIIHDKWSNAGKNWFLSC